jgi:ABC-type Fe3+/spermidine/putrescine transport system ATPase subunit
MVGFIPVSAGTITVNDVEVQQLPPAQRKIMRVGENWGLFPHLNVRRNIEFGLQFGKLKKEEVAEKSESILKKIKLFDKQELYPEGLGIEDRLRLVIGRYAVVSPNLIVFDGSFRGFDSLLRKQLSELISAMQKDLDFPVMMVTEHPLDVMGVSSKILILKNGFMEQFGDTKFVYDNPSSRTVACATGEINVISAQVVMGGDFYMFSTKLGGLNLKTSEKLRVETEVDILIRPEQTRVVPLGKTADARNVFSGKVHAISYMAGFQFLKIKTDDEKLFLSVQNTDFDFKVGDDIDVILNRDEYPIVKK